MGAAAARGEHRQRTVVLKIEMEGGHGGASGRYVQWRERAWDYAFVADSLGATELLPGSRTEVRTPSVAP